MRSQTVLFLAMILGGAMAFPAFGEDANGIIDRIASGEQDFMAQMKGQQPYVETYIQELSPTEGVPMKDDYMLMRLNLAENAGETTVTESARFKPTGMRYFYTGSGMRFRPAGFVRMAFVDLEGINRKAYQFDYVRREFLGDIRCLVFQVSPVNATGSHFMGNIWVDDVDYRIVRFNGTFSGSTNKNLSLHFDSWRLNVAPGVWVPAFVYVEEGNNSPKLAEKYHLKARVMLWGYEKKPGSHLDELSQITVDSGAAEDKTASADMLPLESERDWERQAEQNVLDKLERSGLLAPKGSVDQVLNTVVNNLIATNHIDLDVQCRVLLTTPMETFSMYRTIVISRGLLDVLPDEASLAMVLSEELAHIALGHKTPTAFAFGDATMFADPQILDKLNVARTQAEMDEAGKRAVEILAKSPYAGKLSNAGLFLKAIGGRTQSLASLVHANLGNEFAGRQNLDRLQSLEEKAPPLDNAKIDQIAALPLGSRVKLDPWSNRITLVKTEQLPLFSAREKMPFEITPVMLHLTRVASQNEAAGAAEAASTAHSADLK